MAVRLPFDSAVTPTGGLNAVCVTGGDSQVSFAPDPAAPRQPRDFGQQFEDAQEDANRAQQPVKSDDKPVAPVSRRAGPAPKRPVASLANDKVEAGKYLPIPLAIPPVTTLPLSLSFAPLTNLEETLASKEGTTAPPEESKPEFRTQASGVLTLEMPAIETAPVETPVAGTPSSEKLRPVEKLPPEKPVQSVSEDLTFAVRVQPREAPLPRVLSPNVSRNMVPVAAIRDAHRTESEEDTPPVPPRIENSDGIRSNTLPAPETSTPAPQTPPTTESHTEPAPAVRVPEHMQTEVKPAEPLKQISIQVGQAQQERVELRVVERAGELQVAVRSTNPEVAQGLRQGISELVGRLEQSGFRAEAWRPGGVVTAVEASAEARGKSTEFRHGGSGEQPSNGSQQRGQQGNPHRARPQWVEEMESITGELHGVSR